MRISPFGLWIAFWNSVRLASSKPSWVRSTFSAPLSRMRSVTLSPKSDGSTDIRKSTSCPFWRSLMRPNGHEVDFRMSVLPSLFGESVTLRILDKGALKVDLTQLGFEQASLAEFQKAIQSPNGLTVITGPTGSGKTTTLYSALNAVNSPDRNIVTVEDPVEYELQGITQVQVSEEIGRTFATALRSFLRHDPDVILVGEMRDQETAQIAVRAALTGHLVLSTLHTNSAAQTIS